MLSTILSLDNLQNLIIFRGVSSVGKVGHVPWAPYITLVRGAKKNWI